MVTTKIPIELIADDSIPVAKIVDGADLATLADVAAGDVLIQRARTVYTASGTTTTIIPADATAPQNTEGAEFFTVSITPTSATNKLVISVIVQAQTSVQDRFIAALFKDSDVGALTAGLSSSVNTLGTSGPIVLTYEMTAGTTSSITFKVRAGPAGATTLTMNPFFGGVCHSSIEVKEYLP